MFTGLVQHTARLKSLALTGRAGRLELGADLPQPVLGESIAVNGICLTLTAFRPGLLTFDVLAETLAQTALHAKNTGDLLNLERALKVGDPLGGHLVSGHVDGVGTVLSIQNADRDKAITLSAPALIPGIVYKGSIAIDGVSLTVVSVDTASGTFSVHIIPRTWQETALSSLTAGAEVNLETDLLGKYVQTALSPPTPPAVTWATLRNSGFLDAP